jgi:hypothetical protein
MQASFVILQQSLFGASEPIAIMLWGCVLILLSMKLRSASRSRVAETAVPVASATDSTLVARA